MSDDSFIREVEDELRSDQLQKFWERFKFLIIGGAIAIVVATAGYRYWLHYTESVAAASGTRFQEAIDLSGEGKYDEAIAALEALVEDGSGQYPALAKMRLAAEFIGKDEPLKAVEAFDSLANDTTFDETLRDIAKLRSGLLLVDHGTYDQVADRLESMAETGKEFRHSSREGLGLAAWKAGNYEDALSWFTAIQADVGAPQGIRQRTAIMLELLRGKGFEAKEQDSSGEDS